MKTPGPPKKTSASAATPFNWQQRGWPRFTCARAALREELDAFARAFREAKKALAIPEDPATGARSGLSAAKWMRMTDVSKATATRDLADLAAAGAIVPRGSGPQTRYCLNHPAFELPNEPIDDGMNEGIKAAIRRLVLNHPGRGVPFFQSTLKTSRATAERAVAALVAAGAIEHRGSRKTGGYWPKPPPPPSQP